MTVHPVSGIAAAALPALLASFISVGCAARPAKVSPAEIPSLESQLELQPSNGSLLLRYAAALYADGRCDRAIAVAERGRAARPGDVLGPLVVGRCQEQDGLYDEAIATYESYLDEYGDTKGAAAVQAQARLARRQRAGQLARQALANEAELSPGDPQSLAVLPVVVEGDASLQPLSHGLSALMVADLSLLQRFQLVERVQLNVILQELERQEQLRAEAMLDESTAARVGRLARAGRLVQGLLLVPSEDEVRLEANLVEGDGEIAGTRASEGRLRRLVRMEKDVVLGIVQQLGYELSDAERRRILENGTESLVAFLAYSRGLLEEDRGSYAAAAQFYAQAVRADPTFSEAKQRRDVAIAADVVESAPPGEITTVGAAVETAVATAEVPSAVDVLASVVGEVAPTQAEGASRALSIASSTNAVTTPINRGPALPTGQRVTIRIIVRLPR